MMRTLLNLVLCGAVAAPAIAMAQAVPTVDAEPVPMTLAPLPSVEPTQPAPPAVTAAPPPTAEAGAPAPELAPPTKVAPVLVAKEQKANVAGQAGVLAVGVAAGAGGAAVAGPVGKFAGAFVGKTLARGLFGVGKEKTPELTVIQPDARVAASASGPAVSAVDAAAARQTVAER